MDDYRFFSPMIDSKVGQVFVNDFVDVFISGHIVTGKVKKFFKKVQLLYYTLIYIITFRKDVMIFFW